jgi:hypothetical protein
MFLLGMGFGIGCERHLMTHNSLSNYSFENVLTSFVASEYYDFISFFYLHCIDLLKIPQGLYLVDQYLIIFIHQGVLKV